MTVATPASWRTAEPAARRSASSVSGGAGGNLADAGEDQDGGAGLGQAGEAVGLVGGAGDAKNAQRLGQRLGGLGRQRVLQQDGAVGALSHADDEGVGRGLLQVSGDRHSV